MHTIRIWLIALCLVLCATPALAVDDFYGGGSAGHSAARPHSARHATGKSLWAESYSQEVDVKAFMERLYTFLTSPEYMGQYKESVQAADYLKGLGYFSLAGSQCEYSIKGGELDMYSSCNYADLDPASYCGKILALPNAKPASAKYIGEDDYLAYIVENNVPRMMMIEAEEMNKAQELAKGDSDLAKLLSQANLGDMGDMGQMLGMLKALKLDETMMQALTGELALVLYGVPAFDKLQGNNLQPGDLDLCLMLGLNGDDFISGLITQFGANAGLTKMEAPSGWTGYNIQGQESIGIVYNKEILVLSPNIKATLAHMAQAKGHSLRVPECQVYMDFNVTAMQNNVAAPLVDLAAKQLGDIKLPTAAMSYLVALPAPEELGHMTMMTSYGGDADMMEFHARTAMGKYAAYYLGVGLCAAGQSGMLEKAAQELGIGAPKPEGEDKPESGTIEEK
jgi:hypothetical protein